MVPLKAKLFIPVDDVQHRHGCPARMTPVFRVDTFHNKERTSRTDDFSAMSLIHRSKTGIIKNRLDLAPVHRHLELASLKLYNAGASNIVLASLSFDCCITNSSDKRIYKYITFDLKIPGTGINGSKVLYYDFMEEAYGSKENLYATLNYYYNKGRQLANPTNHTHGMEPSYDPDEPSHDRFIRHTEQMLVAYLAHSKAAVMIHNRLHMELRSHFTDIKAVKIYHMGIHLHSTKTCCAPCEYTLIGLANHKTSAKISGITLGFISSFQKVRQARDFIDFRFPKDNGFKIITTVSASTNDSVHKKEALYWTQEVELTKVFKLYKKIRSTTLNDEMLAQFKSRANIEIKTRESSQIVHTAMLNPGYDHRKIDESETLSDYSVFISGSLLTKGTLPTIAKINKIYTDSHKAAKDLGSYVSKKLNSPFSP